MQASTLGGITERNIIKLKEAGREALGAECLYKRAATSPFLNTASEKRFICPYFAVSVVSLH